MNQKNWENKMKSLYHDPLVPIQYKGLEALEHPDKYLVFPAPFLDRMVSAQINVLYAFHSLNKKNEYGNPELFEVDVKFNKKEIRMEVHLCRNSLGNLRVHMGYRINDSPRVCGEIADGLMDLYRCIFEYMQEISYHRLGLVTEKVGFHIPDELIQTKG